MSAPELRGDGAPRVAVLGAGGVGGFVAVALHRSGAAVTVVARGETATVLSRRGLRVSSRLLGEFTVEPRIVTELDGEPDSDALLIATKANGLPAALERVRVTPPLVVPLLNGIEHLDTLRARFGADRVAAGVIRIESDRPSPGVIVQTSPGCRVDLSVQRAPQLEPAARRLVQALDEAGIPAVLGEREATVMWSKLARLCALALTTSAADRPIGFVRADPRWRSALEGAVNETVAVANARGAGLRAADTLAELDQAHPELGSSMQRDIAAGREPELDAIGGAVLRASATEGLRCPTVAWLVQRVAARAAASGHYLLR